MTAASAVSAVVVNWNGGDYLLRCVESLFAEGVVDVVVVDNASVDGSDEAVARAYPSVVVHDTGANLGYGRGANRGVQRTDRERGYLLVLNADVIVRPGALEALVATLDDDRGAGVAGPRIEQPDGTRYPSARRFPSLVDAAGHALLGLVRPDNPFSRRYRMEGAEPVGPTTVDWVSGSCFLARRSAWDEVGGFDESYFMYAEDLDLCWRLRQAGWRAVYQPAASIVHVQGTATALRPYRMIAEHHRSTLRFAWRTARGPARALLPAVALGLGLRLVLAWAHRFAVERRRGRARRAPAAY